MTIGGRGLHNSYNRVTMCPFYPYCFDMERRTAVTSANYIYELLGKIKNQIRNEEI